MKRAGFTMIELIFVIVILGILAAVALPKFAGVSDQANAQKCAAFVGTLNRTVGPSMWSSSLADSLNGSISSFTTTGTNSTAIPTYIATDDIPTECLGGASDFRTNATVAFGTSTYYFNYTSDGTLSESPRWTWEK